MSLRVLILAAAIAILLVGCGGKTVSPAPDTVEGTLPTTTAESPGGEGDPAAGKETFGTAGCGSCHVLSDAGAAGTIGPNLDETKPDFALVVDRVTNGKGAMPAFKGQLSEQSIDDVAAYVVQATSG